MFLRKSFIETSAPRREFFVVRDAAFERDFLVFRAAEDLRLLLGSRFSRWLMTSVVRSREFTFLTPATSGRYI
jgi:hypothetical protein